jgi:hypothetical protein
MDKTGRNGLRVGDIERPDFMERYATLVAKHERLLGIYDHKVDWKPMEAEWLNAIEELRKFTLVDSEYWMDQLLRAGKNILAEGAQGTLLDIEFGTYPFVTSSNTITAGACIGLGVGPGRIGKSIGIFKAYSTRVGSGPFPTELHDADGEYIRKAGNEFGSTTGRPRRCGWLDLPALRYAVMVNGLTELAMMKADVLSGMPIVRVCTSYRINGKETDRLPFDITTGVEPIYTDMPGWGRSGSQSRIAQGDRGIHPVHRRSRGSAHTLGIHRPGPHRHVAARSPRHGALIHRMAKARARKTQVPATPLALPPVVLQLLGDEAPVLLSALREPPPVSIRQNQLKPAPEQGTPVPWCAHGRYLEERPVFTLDPYFHAGCYYVQEAASMLLEQAFRACGPLPKRAVALDLCAAPGGKTTHLAALLPPDALLVANEPVRARQAALQENLWKWGGPMWW